MWKPNMTGSDIHSHPVYLGIGATAASEPEFTDGMAWYEANIKFHLGDGLNGRLVSLHTFTKSWDTWEMRPNGNEVVICILGEISLIQQDLSGE